MRKGCVMRRELWLTYESRHQVLTDESSSGTSTSRSPWAVSTSRMSSFCVFPYS